MWRQRQRRVGRIAGIRIAAAVDGPAGLLACWPAEKGWGVLLVLGLGLLLLVTVLLACWWLRLLSVL
jgi:hypothetical protein